MKSLKEGSETVHDEKSTTAGANKAPRGLPSVFPVGNHSECVNCSATVLNQFASSFDKSAKRWELIVYPTLFAFIILAMYGFFLIFSLTQDMRSMASAIDPRMGANMGSLTANIKLLSDNMEVMSTHLEYISDNMETMSVDMQSMSENMETMSENVTLMARHVDTMSVAVTDMSTKLNALEPISKNVESMNQAMHVMTNNMARLGYDVGGAARPMSFMNRFMPFGN
ncbi:hypothetical protein Mmc1_3257 [Magnetococcus marinus MC-1]|uniref:Methyl-accepting chemotaxis protein n=1 Tax=Magnetococcus marinus (strain ATCC BAA-1437 / JCM 17883 / MC-1) TaxID=156889 RepID=A0LCQ4_MAGMM|nr:hypothetical protein [Magnetococcus marinus]ABK45747.1 hypothetical protein Mmc1_3257 [Magnetococcus marinus MC-1]